MSEIKIVALNSGGLDSVVLMHHLKEKFPNVKVHTLFFNYGQRAVEFERKASQKVSALLGYEWEELSINFSWSNSTIVSLDTAESYDSLYLEMRNMVFISYATSYAQSVGAVKVYSALIKPPLENPYPDATPEFSTRISSVMSLCGLELCTPFINKDKQYILRLARKYSIGYDDFCSCFHTEKSENDKCSNCEYLERYSEYFEDFNQLEDTYHRTQDISVIDSVRKLGKIISAKLSINNSCNLKCPYCLMTGVNHTEEPEIPLKDLVQKLYSWGIREFDIFGKEPLFDDKAVNLLNDFKDYKDIYFSMITNGKNLDKYSDRLIDSILQEITISYDGGFYRPFTIEDNTISYLINSGLPVSISIDLHNKNWFEINKFLTKFYNLGVSSVFIKPIEDWGGCDKRFSVSEDLYDSVIQEVVSSMFPIPYTTFSIPFKYTGLTKKYSELFKYDIPMYKDRPVRLELDTVCASGYTSIFVNYDGRIYGCGNCAYERPLTGISINDVQNYAQLKELLCNFSGRNCCNPLDYEEK